MFFFLNFQKWAWRYEMTALQVRILTVNIWIVKMKRRANSSTFYPEIEKITEENSYGIFNYAEPHDNRVATRI